MPLLMPMNASRTAVAPEAQALETLMQGTPVWPISLSTFCPSIDCALKHDEA
nr:hypothetical protein [Novosphingobium sp. G106]